MAAPPLRETHRLWRGRPRCGERGSANARPFVTSVPARVTCRRCLALAAPGDEEAQGSLV